MTDTSLLNSPAKLIVLSGLPGTGKSTIAVPLAEQTNATLLVKDVIEAALWRTGIGRDLSSWRVAHEIITATARQELMRWRSVVIDSVATTEEVRRDWRALAADLGVGLFVIECRCSDVELHRARLDGRLRGIDGWPELTWDDVESVRHRWEPWADDHLVVDAVDSVEGNVRAALSYVVGG